MQYASRKGSSTRVTGRKKENDVGFQPIRAAHQRQSRSVVSRTGSQSNLEIFTHVDSKKDNNNNNAGIPQDGESHARKSRENQRANQRPRSRTSPPARDQSERRLPDQMSWALRRGRPWKRVCFLPCAVTVFNLICIGGEWGRSTARRW